ncbi:unnamed protein product [Knipowitschia caucasica]|uniref:Ribosomal protein S14 n=1 Tax=Knipowitschia caucasica TaxID=637954 RepID=A0AAV2LQ00_KNICA
MEKERESAASERQKRYKEEKESKLRPMLKDGRLRTRCQATGTRNQPVIFLITIERHCSSGGKMASLLFFYEKNTQQEYA